MTQLQPCYKYNHGKVWSRHEEDVRDRLQYPFVSTTTLGPGQGLGAHRHGSPNIHKIVSGSITITQYPGHQGAPAVVTTAKKGDEIKVPAGVWYTGVAFGKKGCVFVEGHTVLSPNTADRFYSRGDIDEVGRLPEGTFTYASNRPSGS